MPYLSMSLSMLSLMADLQALWQISVMSAPEKPCVKRVRVSMSTSGATGDLRRHACVHGTTNTEQQTV